MDNNSFFYDEDDNKGIISDINVTPLVDVMLVLLIVFIITMPIVFTQIHLNTPTSSILHKNIDDIEPPLIKITLDKSGNYYLDDQLITASNLQAYIHNQLSTDEKKKNTVFALNADIDTKYGQLIRLIEIIQQEGGTKIGYMQELK